MGTNKKPGGFVRVLTLTVSGVLLVTAGLLAGAALTREQLYAAPEPLPIQAAVTPEVIALPAPETPAPTPEADPASAAELTVAPTCQMVWATNFTLCGHVREETRQDRELVGLTEQQVRAATPDWTLESFSRVGMRFSRVAEAYCPDHVLLKSVPEGLGVYRTDPATLELQEIMQFPIDTASLDEEMRLQLALGMPFADLAEIEGYIESLES